jgi:hypothetical protein
MITCLQSSIEPECILSHGLHLRINLRLSYHQSRRAVCRQELDHDCFELSQGQQGLGYKR